MDFKKIAPWNWFKKEEEAGSTIPVKYSGQKQPPRQFYEPIGSLHQEIDQLFENFFRGGGLTSFKAGSLFNSSLTDGLLKPTLDIGATEKEYVISVEVPGVDQKDVKLEIANNTLTVCGKKNKEEEEKGKNYYRMERSYGSFQRVLSLPDDADQDKIKATFKNGVLTVAIPRKSLPSSERALKQIEIK